MNYSIREERQLEWVFFMKKEELIWNFIENFGRKEDILGIIFYGSSCYKTDMLGSDIDLLFITDGDKNYKGTTYIEGIKIEYFF